MVTLAGNLGVSTFFFISGFVICRLIILEEKRFGSVSVKGFYYRRIFRILPALYTYLAVIALLMAAGLLVGVWNALPVAATFSQNFVLVPRNSFVLHTWSLAVEEQFYLIFPAMWVLTPLQWRSRTFAGTLLLLAASSVALCTLIRQPVRLDFWGYTAISAGVLAAINERRLRTAVSHVPGVLVAVVALILLIRPARERHPYDMALFGAVFMPPAICLVLMYSLERGRWLRAVLCSRPFQAIGLTSYGIYLWQQLFTAPQNQYTQRGAAIAYMLPMMLVVVSFSYFFIEKPCMRFGKLLSRKAREARSGRTNSLTAGK
jgi:peptidoglycan/LPS O-acetylase OafA/YrhL